MTRNEFDDWLDNHTAHFPGVGTWLAKFGETQSAAVLRVWFGHLSHCDADDARKATTRLFDRAGRAPVYERHAQAIRAIVREIELERTAEQLRPQYIEGQQVYQCPDCRDDGRLICWDPKSMKAAAEGTLGEPFTVYKCAVACTCSAGDHHATYLARYDPQRWLLWPQGPVVVQRHYEQLRQFVAQIPIRQKQEVMF